MGSGKAGGGEHRSAKRERESEDGVLPLDHFQSDAEAMEDGHGKIVKQNGCQFSVLRMNGFSASGDTRALDSASPLFCERLTRTPDTD